MKTMRKKDVVLGQRYSVVKGMFEGMAGAAVEFGPPGYVHIEFSPNNGAWIPWSHLGAAMQEVA